MTTNKHLEWIRVPTVFGEYTDFAKLQRHYELVRKHLIKKVQNGEKLRVAFYILYDSMFSAKALYHLMLKDEMFEPFIVAIPNALSGADDVLGQMEKKYEALSKEFDEVYPAFSRKKGFVDFSQEADLICFCTPYDNVTHEFYTVKHALNLRVLPFMLSYGFFMSKLSVKHVFDLASYNSVWKAFVDTEMNLAAFQAHTHTQGKNAVLTGYGKMDGLAQFQPKSRDRKKIIIAPHHSILTNDYCPIGNFLEYAPFFLELPKIYPNIDFVFRPHPALFDKLYGDNFWTMDEIESYLSKMQAFPNVVYQAGGDYLEVFANSDALIHDCASFIAEYLYTGKPCCYMLRDHENLPNVLSSFSLECIQQHERAYFTEDIIKFIDEVVVKDIDSKKEERITFANKYIKINYPHASNKILDHIKQELS